MYVCGCRQVQDSSEGTAKSQRALAGTHAHTHTHTHKQPERKTVSRNKFRSFVRVSQSVSPSVEPNDAKKLIREGHPRDRQRADIQVDRWCREGESLDRQTDSVHLGLHSDTIERYKHTLTHTHLHTHTHTHTHTRVRQRVLFPSRWFLAGSFIRQSIVSTLGSQTHTREGKEASQPACPLCFLSFVLPVAMLQLTTRTSLNDRPTHYAHGHGHAHDDTTRHDMTSPAQRNGRHIGGTDQGRSHVCRYGRM